MINYHKGDLFEFAIKKYLSDEPIVIPHVVNDIGAWGSGFVVPLGNKYPKSKEKYLEWAEKDKPFKGRMLGKGQLVNCAEELWVYNMCAQSGTICESNPKPIKYSALLDCMRSLRDHHSIDGAHIICPKFGSDRAGGSWELIEELIKEVWCPRWDVTVCVLGE